MTANLYIQSMQLTDLWLVSPARLDSRQQAVTQRGHALNYADICRILSLNKT